MNVLPAIAELSTAHRTATGAAHKAEWGQFFTGPEVAAFMANLIDQRPGRTLRILDPGAGTGILGVAAAEAALDGGAASVSLIAVEAEPSVQPALHTAMDLLCRRHPGRVATEVHQGDFLSLDQPRVGVATNPGDYDVAISNPPYFKMSPGSGEGGDAPNAYARFMEVAGRLVRPGGQLVFIVPRSFASGLYFKRFRKRFHSVMALERVHVFESRRRAFQEDDVLQENVIVAYRKTSVAPSTVAISTSEGPETIWSALPLRVPHALIIHPGDPAAVIFLPTSDADLNTIRRLRRWPATLHHLGLEVSTGPVVPFRTDAMVDRPTGKPVVPLLWMQHVRDGEVTWPLANGFHKPEYIEADAGDKLLVPNTTYILLRRFSTKEEPRRLTPAVLEAGAVPGGVVGLENHLNFIHCPGGVVDRDEAYGLAAVLSCTLIDDYFRMSNGNTQVNATDLRCLPLPGRGPLRALGRSVLEAAPGGGRRLEAIDQLVATVLGP